VLDVAQELIAERGRRALGTGVTSSAVDSLRAVLGHQLGGGDLES
jgi:hypothetical protein